MGNQKKIIRLEISGSGYNQQTAVTTAVKDALAEAHLKINQLEKISQNDQGVVFQLISETGAGQVIIKALSGILPADKIEVNRDRDGYALLNEEDKTKLTAELAETIYHLAQSQYVNRGEEGRYTPIKPQVMAEIVKQAAKKVIAKINEDNPNL